MKRLLREPLLHFLLLGAGLFVAYGLRPHPGRDEAAGRIVVTQGQIENLADGFARAWQRPPTSEELAGLIRDHVREEVYCREAIALGLDKDDTVIRRRLRQKLEFVSEDLAGDAEPTDGDLRAYFAAHQDAFRVLGRVPPFEEVKEAVRREWADARRLEANDAYYKRLLGRYAVTVERDPAAGAGW